MNRLKLLLASIFLVFIGQLNAQSEMSSLVPGINAENLEWGNCPPFIPDGCFISVLHGDPAVGNFDLLFKIPGKFKVPNHYHTSPERMVLLSGQLKVTYEGEETRLMNKGDYAYGPAKKPHVAECVSDVPCVLFIAFEAPLDAIEVK